MQATALISKRKPFREIRIPDKVPRIWVKLITSSDRQTSVKASALILRCPAVSVRVFTYVEREEFRAADKRRRECKEMMVHPGRRRGEDSRNHAFRQRRAEATLRTTNHRGQTVVIRKSDNRLLVVVDHFINAGSVLQGDFGASNTGTYPLSP